MVTPYPSVPHGQVKFLGIDMNDNNGNIIKLLVKKRKTFILGVIMNIVFNGLSYNKMMDRLSE